MRKRALSRRHRLPGGGEEKTGPAAAMATSTGLPLRGMHTLLSALLLLSFASTATTHMVSLSPVIRLPVGTGDHLVVDEGHELRLRCEGAGPMRWSFPPDALNRPMITLYPASDGLTQSILQRAPALRQHTGLYDCSSGLHGDFIYVYVASKTTPWVREKLSIHVKEFSDARIDCRPNSPRIKVRLVHESGYEVPLDENAESGATLSWRERDGFLWTNVSRKLSGRYYCVSDVPDSTQPPPSLPVDLRVSSGLRLNPEGNGGHGGHGGYGKFGGNGGREANGRHFGNGTFGGHVENGTFGGNNGREANGGHFGNGTFGGKGGERASGRNGNGSNGRSGRNGRRGRYGGNVRYEGNRPFRKIPAPLSSPKRYKYCNRYLCYVIYVYKNE